MKRCISNEEIEVLCEALIKSFLRKLNYGPAHCIDIDGFITEYLGASIQYEAFAEFDRRKLGYLSDGKEPLRVVRNGKISSPVFPKNTIVIEKYLLTPCECGRRRFTAAHEAGHLILQRYCSLESQASFYREFDSSPEYEKIKMKEIYDINEKYANRAAACLLMPGYLMAQLLREQNFGRPIAIYDRVLAMREKFLIQKMADLVGVSSTSFFNRLKELNLLDRRPVEEYMEEKILTEEQNGKGIPSGRGDTETAGSFKGEI